MPPKWSFVVSVAPKMFVEGPRLPPNRKASSKHIRINSRSHLTKLAKARTETHRDWPGCHPLNPKGVPFSDKQDVCFRT